MSNTAFSDDNPQFGFRASSRQEAGEIRAFAERTKKSLTEVFMGGAQLYMEGKIVADLADELVSGPLLDTRVACGAPSTADEAATSFVLSRRVADEFQFDPSNDYFIRARGDSMEGRGILDEFVVALTPLKVGALPRVGKIVLMALTDADNNVTGTLKGWNGEKNGVPQLLDGAGEAFLLPEGIIRAQPVAIAKGVIGEL